MKTYCSGEESGGGLSLCACVSSLFLNGPLDRLDAMGYFSFVSCSFLPQQDWKNNTLYRGPPVVSLEK